MFTPARTPGNRSIFSVYVYSYRAWGPQEAGHAWQGAALGAPQERGRHEVARRQGAWGHVEHVDDPHLTARRALPLGVERTGQRSVHCHSSVNVRGGTFRGEWQCVSHCHSGVSVPGSAPYTATRHRAYRIGTFRAEWQCGRYAQGRVAVRLTLPLGGERTGQRALHCHSSVNVRIGTFRAEWQCWPGRTSNPQPSCRLESGPTGQMRSGNRPPGRRGSRQSPQASAWGLAARKGAVWAEGLADGAPWARPGHHQAASCGLRRCRELRLRQGPGV